MKCAKCGVEYSDRVFPLHVPRCPGRENANDEPIQEKKETTEKIVVRKRAVAK